MKLLHIIGEMGYGGAELLTSQLAGRMHELGTDVTIAVLGFCDEQLAATVAMRGVKVIRFDANLNSLLNIWRIMKLLRSSRYDVVHVHLFPALYWGALARSITRNKASWVYTEHSTNNRRRHFVLLRSVESVIYQVYDTVVCISADAQLELQRWLPGLNNLTVIENGIDLARFREATPIPRSTLNLSGEDVVIFMAGAFRQEKNQATLIKALATLPKEYKLVLAGDGPELSKVKGLANQLGLNDRVVFLGAVSGIERIMKAADVYVLPSFFEGFGLSAVEAAAAEIPIVFADVPGLSNVLGDGGIRVDPHDESAMAGAIKQLIDDEHRRALVVSRANKMASRWDIETTSNNYARLYMVAH